MKVLILLFSIILFSANSFGAQKTYPCIKADEVDAYLKYKGCAPMEMKQMAFDGNPALIVEIAEAKAANAQKLGGSYSPGDFVNGIFDDDDCRLISILAYSPVPKEKKQIEAIKKIMSWGSTDLNEFDSTVTFNQSMAINAVCRHGLENSIYKSYNAKRKHALKEITPLRLAMETSNFAFVKAFVDKYKDGLKAQKEWDRKHPDKATTVLTDYNDPIFKDAAVTFGEILLEPELVDDNVYCSSKPECRNEAGERVTCKYGMESKCYDSNPACKKNPWGRCAYQVKVRVVKRTMNNTPLYRVKKDRIRLEDFYYMGDNYIAGLRGPSYSQPKFELYSPANQAVTYDSPLIPPSKTIERNSPYPPDDQRSVINLLATVDSFDVNDSPKYDPQMSLELQGDRSDVSVLLSNVALNAGAVTACARKENARKLVPSSLLIFANKNTAVCDMYGDLASNTRNLLEVQ